MLYEMKLPVGITEKELANVIDKFDVDLAHSDFGPVLKGSEEELEKAYEVLVDSLKKRVAKYDK